MTEDLKSRVLSAVQKIEKNDAQLGSELKKVRSNIKYVKEAAAIKPKLKDFENTLESMDDGSEMALETIVLRVGRPVLTVNNGAAILEFRDTESEVWRERLENARQRLLAPTAAVGRIELQNHPRGVEWVGTGWLVDDELIVTNRHVAEVFAVNNGGRFVYRAGRDNSAMRAQVDFLEEADRPDEFTFQLVDVLHIEPERGPDMALIKVKPVAGKKLPAPIPFSTSAATSGQDIVVVGYPAKDSRIPDQQLMLDIFGDVFDKKRLAPGQVINSSDKEVLHDATTFGGNSGSVLIDMKTGEAIGLHFAGRFLESNFAVSAAVIKKKIKSLSGNGPIVSRNGKHEHADDNGNGHAKPVVMTPTKKVPVGDTTLAHAIRNRIKGTSFTIPLHLTISIGDLVQYADIAEPVPHAGTTIAPMPPLPQPDTTPEEEQEFFTEAVPEDYDDREGYDVDFLDVTIPLPQIKSVTKRKDILKLVDTDNPELKYRHFSVLMSKSRRQCFFSACNIDGKSSKKNVKRSAWRLDPRIPEEAQIMKECYGNPPKFSRGHMTRREDPIWGKIADARQGNDDSMHVTNAVPQMQGMNAGMWLGLENYALHNARKDGMRISVFTGPIFKNNDPIRDGVKIPLSFWKVIAFIHDETGELCATGYSMSQEDFIDEFIFDEHNASQVAIAWIEKQTGLSFGDLTDLDPFGTVTEGISPEGPIMDFEQIRFF